jgi:hypothetical protein
MEQLNYNLLFPWFVGLSPDDEVWDVTSSPRIASGCCRVTSPCCSLRGLLLLILKDARRGRSVSACDGTWPELTH